MSDPKPEDAETDRSPMETLAKSAKRYASVALIVILVFWAITLSCDWNIQSPALFGDSVAPITGLLTAFALLASIQALRMQSKELALQREEMAAQREEVAKQTGAQKELVRAQQRLVEAQDKNTAATIALARATLFDPQSTKTVAQDGRVGPKEQARYAAAHKELGAIRSGLDKVERQIEPQDVNDVIKRMAAWFKRTGQDRSSPGQDGPGEDDEHPEDAGTNDGTKPDKPSES